MAQAGLMEIMDEMADQIRAAMVQVTDVAVQVEPRLVINPTPPCIDIYLGDSPRDRETAGFAEGDDDGYFLTVRARVHTADTTAGQDLLLAFFDPTNTLSLGQALYDDPTLNGYASDVDITGQTGYAMYPTDEGVLLGRQLNVRVIPAYS